MVDLVTPTMGFAITVGLIIFFETRRRGPCPHTNTRCLHGDEITARMKVHILRWWKEEVIRRQVCRDCGAALDRLAICTATGENLHEWEGPWPYNQKDE